METNSVAFFQSQSYPDLPCNPIVAAYQVKNPQNVGSLMRLIDNIGGDTLVLLDDENAKRASLIKKTAGLSFNNVQLLRMTSTGFFQSILPGYTVFAVETSEESSNIFATALPERPVFLLGSEMHGLPVELIAQCDHSIHIPMTGKCKSMNISHALTVVLFEWQRQQLFRK